MPDEEIYEKLRQVLDKHPTGCVSSPEIYEILKILFTEEEAKVAICMNFVPKSVKWISERAGIPEEEVKIRLESLADKGIIYAREKEGEWRYALLPVMPGIFEFPYMKGKKTELLEKLTPLWKSYLPKLSKEFGTSSTSFSRIIPIQEEIKNIPGILTYEMVYELIDKAKTTGIAHCACREVEEKCDAPRESCMIFDETCDFLVKRGFARYITKEEMKEKLKEFDKIGLVLMF
jgi:DNA-binding Lrp family transcriptional regulator